MTRRSFIFCDICNPMSLRAVEMRRSVSGRDPRVGRRISDGRSWFEGDDEAAKQAGWLIVASSGQHVCPTCCGHLHSRREVLLEKLRVSEDALDTLLRDKNPL
jgi:hypothetical protein